MKKEHRLALLRLRLGVFLIFIWWIPLYVIVPAAAATFNARSAQSQEEIFIGMIIVQSVLGIIGFFMVGKTLASDMRKVYFKKMPKVIWGMIWHGQMEIDPSCIKPAKPNKESHLKSLEKKLHLKKGGKTK